MRRVASLSNQLYRDRAGVTALGYGLVVSALLGIVMVGFAELANALDASWATSLASL